ncbi:tyrosine-type recombinase/integrase [Variovorax paradoxus]|nr:tyrosine-type recombinase/integrase [Variovorax paradoxus]
MLSKFFGESARICAIRSGPSGPLLEDFAGYLFRSGYSKISARRHIRSAEHIVQWALRNGLSVDGLDGPALERFGKHLCRCRCGRFYCAARVDILTGARLFLTNLHCLEGKAICLAEAVGPEPELFKSFCQWMRDQRGSTDGTLSNYGRSIRELIRLHGEDPSKLTARCLRQFVMARSQHVGWAAANHCTTGLRMFLRYLIADGRCSAGLLGAIPKLAHWRLSSLPRVLAPADVERVIASCDLSSPAGKRDRAILLLLARLGLRAGDIVQLRLHDIDWKEATIQVCGKSRRQTRLPLSQEVGQAIVDYLQHGRPATCNDELFLRSRAPFRGLKSHCAVSMLVDRAICRAGVAKPARGAAHLLRHSVASSMLRQGASLQEIADLLRHRSVETTQIYAKVDVTSLQQIAQPWPEVSPC